MGNSYSENYNLQNALRQEWRGLQMKYIVNPIEDSSMKQNIKHSDSNQQPNFRQISSAIKCLEIV